jgi:hypothetical protein
MSATSSGSGVVFLDPVRHLRIDIMKQVSHGFLMDKVRWSRYFVAASEDSSALCDSVKMDLAEVDSKTRPCPHSPFPVHLLAPIHCVEKTTVLNVGWQCVIGVALFFTLPFALFFFLPSCPPLVSTHHRLQHSSLIFFVYSKTILSTDALRLNLINPSSSFHQARFTSAEMAAGPSSQGNSESLPIPEGRFARVFRIHENHNGTLDSKQIGFGQMLDYEGPKRNSKVTVCLVAEGDRLLLWIAILAAISATTQSSNTWSRPTCSRPDLRRITAT